MSDPSQKLEKNASSWKLQTETVLCEYLPEVPLVHIAPYKGQSMSVANAVRAVTGLTLPKVEGISGRKHKIVWAGSGQWIALGFMYSDLSRALEGVAMVSDISAAWTRLYLAGETEPLMQRMTSVDLANIAPNHVKECEVLNLPSLVYRERSGLVIHLPKSAVNWARIRIESHLKNIAYAEQSRGDYPQH